MTATAHEGLQEPTKVTRSPAGVAALAGILVAAAPWGPLTFTVGAFVVCTCTLEFLRRKAVPAVPWWTAHVGTVPWCAIVLLPWMYFAHKGQWFLLGVPISVSLTHTWTIHLLALLGLTVGTAAALLPRSRAFLSRADEVDWAVDWTKVSTFLGVAMGVYLASFVIAQRPLAALWRLSGSIRYFDNPDQATGLAVLEYTTTVATGVLLVATAVRRRVTAHPPLAEVAWLVVLAVVTLGSGSRSRLYLVVVGWLLLQTRPLFTRASAAGRTLMVLAAAGFVMVALLVAGTISVLRTRGLESQSGSYVEATIRGLDVDASSELLVMRGGTPGILGGRSYLEFPKLLIPRRFAGAGKITPAADDLVRNRLDRNAGFSAPLWFEPMLNFGNAGVLASMAALAWLCAWLLRRTADRVANRFAACVHLLGPVWVLLGYLALSRLTALQLLLTIGSVIAGAYVGSRCLGYGSRSLERWGAPV